MKLFSSTPEWLRDLQFWVRRMRAKRPHQHFSNFGEQQIIDKYVESLKINSRTAVDIGAGDGIRSSNTFHLFSDGWKGVGIEVDEAKYERLKKTYSSFAGVAASNEMISPGNASDVLTTYSVERDFGILSLDIDGNDYWVLDAILSNYRPQLIISEYNEKIPPPIKFTVEFDPDFYLRNHFFGYSIAKLDDLLQKHNYALLEVEYNNVFLAPKELAGAFGKSAEAAYREGYRDRSDRKEKFPSNENMEILHSLEPEAGIEYLEKFYQEHRGKYRIEL
ncbi:MAG: hypothetical protein ABIO36_06430 [Pyrinomonadaceae bacterium]